MSPRAAARLESLGFTEVYDYVAGKADWAAMGLPLKGRLADISRAGDVARRGMPTCRLTERLGAVRERVQSTGWDVCLVVDDAGVVLGRLRKAAFEKDPDAARYGRGCGKSDGRRTNDNPTPHGKGKEHSCVCGFFLCRQLTVLNQVAEAPLSGNLLWRQ